MPTDATTDRRTATEQTRTLPSGITAPTTATGGPTARRGVASGGGAA